MRRARGRSDRKNVPDRVEIARKVRDRPSQDVPFAEEDPVILEDATTEQARDSPNMIGEFAGGPHGMLDGISAAEPAGARVAERCLEDDALMGVWWQETERAIGSEVALAVGKP